VPKYLIGRCVECNAINAAAIHMEFDTAKSWQETHAEFVESGLIVTEMESIDRVTIRGCADGCSIGDARSKKWASLKVYQDSEGNDCTIYQMIRREPDWAANRIQEGEKAIAEVERLTALVSELENSDYWQGRNDGYEAGLSRAMELAVAWRGADGISCSHRLDIAADIRAEAVQP
jgi:hypothetical protein